MGKRTKKAALAISNRQSEAGVTLLEILIVVALIALISGLSYPSVSAGLDSLRMRQATDQVGSFLTIALDQADRKQEVVEVRILPEQNTMLARSADATFARQLQVPEAVRIVSVAPALPGVALDQPRRFLIYPGGAVPAIAVELAGPAGRRRLVQLDPFTGIARAEAPLP